MLAPFGTRPLERQRSTHLERLPLRGESVELSLQRGRKSPRAPIPLELARELFGTSAVGEPRSADPLPAPHLRNERPVDRLEDPGIAAGREVAEDPAVEAVLRLRDEVEDVVRQAFRRSRSTRTRDPARGRG